MVKRAQSVPVDAQNKRARKSREVVNGQLASLPSLSNKRVVRTRSVSSNKAATDKRRAVRDQSAKKAPSADKVSTRRTSRTKPDAQNMADESNESSSDSDSEELSERSAQGATKSQPLLHIPTYETDSDSETEEVDPVQLQRTTNDNTDSISEAARAHISVLSGGQPNLGSIEAPVFSEPISVPISSQIPSKLKRKIWANKYVDFATLLPNYSTQPKQQKFTLQLSNDSTFNLVPQSYNRITQIEQWTSALIRFVAVHSEKYPQEASQLMKYGEVIRDLAFRRPGLSWYNYDMQFRHLRETIAYRWDRIQYDLWVPAATFYNAMPGLNRPRQQVNLNGNRRNGNPFLRNCCWAFNRSGCTKQDCIFPHTCGLCRGSHSAKQCTQSQAKPGPDTRGPQGGSGPTTGARTAQGNGRGRLPFSRR